MTTSSSLGSHSETRKVYFQQNYGLGRATQYFAVLVMIGMAIWFPISIINSTLRVWGDEGWARLRDDWGFMGCLPLILVVSALPIAVVLRTRIVTTPEGVEFRAMLFSLSAPWSAVKRMDQDRDWCGMPMEYLRLREPATVRGLRWLVGERQRWSIPLFMVTRVPFEFTQDLREYAPQVVESRQR